MNTAAALDFELPRRLEAAEPPEVRGDGRDDVRLLVASRSGGWLIHAVARDLPEFLRPGDVLVLNTSGTLPAAVDAVDEAGRRLALHFSSPAPNASDPRLWVVEARLHAGRTTTPFAPLVPGAALSLAGGGRARLLAPHARRSRLWIAQLELQSAVESYLEAHGRPIRYEYVEREWPIEAYQTVYATEPGSAEMPSAGRPLTERILTSLVAKGVLVAPLVLHTGVSSLDSDEPPYPERFRVPRATAALVNAARSWGGRVVAVGTTAVRALESAVDDYGAVGPAAGWTDLVVTPERGVRVVDGILTGWHEPNATHLQMLTAIAGRDLIASSYRAALAEGYRWHEFGDLELILP